MSSLVLRARSWLYISRAEVLRCLCFVAMHRFLPVSAACLSSYCDAGSLVCQRQTNGKVSRRRHVLLPLRFAGTRAVRLPFWSHLGRLQKEAGAVCSAQTDCASGHCCNYIDGSCPTDGSPPVCVDAVGRWMVNRPHTMIE